ADERPEHVPLAGPQAVEQLLVGVRGVAGGVRHVPDTLYARGRPGVRAAAGNEATGRMYLSGRRTPCQVERAGSPLAALRPRGRNAASGGDSRQKVAAVLN